MARAQAAHRSDAPSWLRWPVLAACAAIAIYLLRDALADVSVHDIDAYWNAAQRIRSGGEIYEAESNIHHYALYRYAPWFAFAWVPLTYLPFELVKWAWFAVLLAAALAVIVDVSRRDFLGLGLALVIGPFLVWTAALGNVQPLLVAVLHFGVERRSGPLWIALAGSLKAAPIVLLLVYLGRGEWRKVVAGLAIFGILVLPMAWMEGYTTEGGLTFSLYGWNPVLYAAVALLVAACAVAFARTRWAWLVGNAAVIAALPRLLMYDLTFLLPGYRGRRPRDPSPAAAQAASSSGG